MGEIGTFWALGGSGQHGRFTFSTQKEGRDWAFQALINLGRFGLSATSTPGGVAHCARMPSGLRSFPWHGDLSDLPMTTHTS